MKKSGSSSQEIDLEARGAWSTVQVYRVRHFKKILKVENELVELQALLEKNEVCMKPRFHSRLPFATEHGGSIRVFTVGHYCLPQGGTAA